MSIIYLTSEYPALSHTFIRREIAALRDRGLDIRPFSVRPGKVDWGEQVPAILGRSKIRVVLDAAAACGRNPAGAVRALLLAQRHREKGLKGWWWSWFHLVEALALTSMVRAREPRRLHSHFANSGATVGMLAAHYLGIPWSVTLHAYSEYDPPAGDMLPDKLLRADFVSCASWFMKSHAMRITPVACWDKYHIVRCGVSVPPDGAITISRQPVRTFLMVGRLAEQKGYPGLIAAMRELADRGVDVRVRIVGDGPMRADIERAIDRYGLQERIALLGPLMEQDTLREVEKADGFVLPSLIEGLPVVLMEALAAGKPVIAPVVAGIPELVEHERTGLTFTVADWSDLARQMERLATDGLLGARLAEAGRARILEEFAIDKAVEPLVPLLSR